MSHYYQMLERKVEALDRYARFRHYATDIMEAPYVWGGESIFGADCSGTVCLPLLKLGYDIRVPASVLFKELFIHRVGGYHDKHVAAVFVVTDTRRFVGDKYVDPGAPTHVMPVVGEETVLDAMWGGTCTLRSWQALELAYVTDDAHIETRAMDWGRAREMHESHAWEWAVDPEVKLMLS